ncbi:AfsR/SARP family transcriptional regulator [Streptacidiphilus jiangxiensis]|uniref:AfsR/SARP family transcriptional regulator n=1 Tax=Streptacidiphilus jiangxiensis TaxID=235985 RepID=UPI00137888F7|nr:BTAD domain-containing putative transcriptional regulator [Streptacidiphilus jiangxiensis]
MLPERMLALLLIEAGRTVSVSRLVDAVWDTAPPATANHQVRKMVAGLRNRIPSGREVLQTDGLGYRVVLAPEQLDLGVFTVRLRRSREAAAAGLRENAIEELRAGLDLWRGPLPAGSGGASLDAVFAELCELRLTAVEELVTLRLETDSGPDLIGELRRLTAEHPLRERLLGHLMLALYRSGRQAEALAEYTRLRERLAEELGIDPCPHLVELHGAILRGSPELSPPAAARPDSPSRTRTARTGTAEEPDNGAPDGAAPEHAAGGGAAAGGAVPAGGAPATEHRAPNSLPYDVPDFTGRQQELAELLRQAEPGPRTTIVCLEGMGGSGKTTLAVHAAHRLAARYPDGQLCIDLAGFTPGAAPLEPGAALDVLLRTLNVPGERIPDELLSRIALWRVVTAHRRMLVLLDNAVDAHQVQPLLPASPGSLVLVTSRVRLSGLDGARVVPVDVMSVADSEELLARVLGDERVAAEPVATGQLIDQCGRLPIALRISAGRLADRPRWTLAHLAERLGEENRRLRELRDGARSVAASISLSFEAMTEELQAAFRRLGVLPGNSFDAHAAAALFGCDVYEAMDLLEELVDVNLLRQQSEDHYSCHDLVRSYAHRLVESEPLPEDDEALERLLDHYYLALAAASERLHPGKQIDHREGAWRPALPLHFPEAEQALGWLQRERVNLVTAVRLARRQRRYWHAVMLPRHLSEYLSLYGHLQQSLEVEQEAVAAAEQIGDDELWLHARLNLAASLWNLSRHEEGLDQTRAALELATGSGNALAEAMCLSRIGLFHSQLGEFSESLRHLERAQEIQRRLGGARELAGIAVSISSACGYLGRYDRSAEAAREAASLYQDLGEVLGETLALVNLANADVGQDDPRAALDRLQHAWGLAQQRRDRAYTSLVVARLTQVQLLLGDRTAARRGAGVIREALSAGLNPSRAVTLKNVLGSVHFAWSQFQEARRCLEEALEQAERIGFRLGEAEARQGLARVLTALGETDTATSHRTRAQALFDTMAIPLGHVRTS